ncbi:hypothetical protein [Bifidobacterium sp. A11]|uniref:hypothetical protein n=1 Tax=Bifidobacterium sp. A11 TaxID=1394176 RepID=UPI0004646EDF|nr:hypothetical protein [Bifidobacterium sp. A11]
MESTTKKKIDKFAEIQRQRLPRADTSSNLIIDILYQQCSPKLTRFLSTAQDDLYTYAKQLNGDITDSEQLEDICKDLGRTLSVLKAFNEDLDYESIGCTLVCDNPNQWKQFKHALHILQAGPASWRKPRQPFDVYKLERTALFSLL